MPYRVMISLETEDGQLLVSAFSDSLGLGFKPVVRSVCVEGHAGFREHCVVSNFSREEVLSWSFPSEGARAAGKIRLFARVRALTLSGQVFLEESKEFFVRSGASSGGLDNVRSNGRVPQIVDTVAYRFTESSKVVCRTLVNVACNPALHQACQIEAMLEAPGEQPKHLGKYGVPLPSSTIVAWQGLELVQVPLEFEAAIPGLGFSTPYTIKLTLLSRSGAVLETIHQPLGEGGVLSGVVPANGANGNHVESISQKRGGLFGWFGR